MGKDVKGEKHGGRDYEENGRGGDVFKVGGGLGKKGTGWGLKRHVGLQKKA